MRFRRSPLDGVAIGLPIVAFAGLGAGSATAQTTYSLTPADNWLGVINGEGLAPGDTVILGGGTYMTPDHVMLDIAHVGTATQPIVIKAVPGQTPRITRNTYGNFDDYYQNLQHNVVNMRGAQHVVLDGLEITGGNWGIRIGAKTDGIAPVPERPMGNVIRSAHHITVQNCHIHYTHNTAVSANFPGDVYDALVFRNNDIHHAARYGEAFYFGNYSNTGETWSIVKNSVIENNHLHDNVWVNSWYQDPNGPSYHGTAIQLKDGCYNNLIRDNVMHYTRYPAVLISGAESAFGARGDPDWGPNIVEGNVVWQVSKAPGDITGQGMQIAADAIVRNNVVYAPQPFYNSNHQCLAGNLELVANTFISSTAAQLETIWMVSQPSAPVLVANNALYRGPGRSDVVTGAGSSSLFVSQTGNVAIADLATAFWNPSSLDFFPVAGSPLVNAADLAFRPPLDFNRTDRSTDATAGAYAFDPGGNPGWKIVPGAKAIPLAVAIEGQPANISASVGGVHELRVDFGASLGGRRFLLVGSAAGTAPGIMVEKVHMPLNPDWYTDLTLRAPNSGPFLGTLGLLGPAGTGSGYVTVPAGLGALVGLTLHHAAIVFAPTAMTIERVSFAVPLVLSP